MIEIKTRRAKFIDIDLNFKSHPVTNDLTKKIDGNAISTSLRNLVMTRKFDHPFHPEIYSPVHDSLFEHMTLDSRANIKRSIEYLVTNFEPRVELVKVDTFPYPTENGVDVYIYYRIIGTVETLKTTIKLDRIL